MRTSLILAAVLLAAPVAAHASGGAPAHAAAPASAAAQAQARAAAQAKHAAARKAAAEARLERVEDRIKTLRALALANRLNLDSATALKLNAIMERYDEQRAGIREQLKAGMQTLVQASHAKTPDADTVDTAVKEVLDAQAKIDDLRAQEAQEMMQGLTPRQKARLMRFYRDFPREIRRLLHRAERLRELRGPKPGAGPATAAGR